MKKENIALIVVSVVLVGIFVYSLFFSTPTYTVTFNTDGGSAVASVEVKRNETITKPSNPTKDGYKFVSWQVDGVDYDFSTPVKENMTIKAKWEKEEEEKTTTKKGSKTTKKTTTTSKTTTTEKSTTKATTKKSK